MSRMTVRWGAFAWALGLALMLGCEKSHMRGEGEGSSSGASADDDGNAAGGAGPNLGEVSKDADAVVMAGMGDAVLELDDGLRLEVPAGAVEAPTEIGVSVLSTSPRGFALQSPLYRFEPAGLRFERPITVRLPIAGTPPDDATIYWTDPAGGFAALDARVDGDAMVAEISHFSMAFVGTITEKTGTGACQGAGECAGITGVAAESVDLLFMVDSSGSMREEQAALAEQFPRLVHVLTTGDLDRDGSADFVPVQDLHLGVVSADMGLVGIQGIPGCDGLGDDGILNRNPNPMLAGCQATFPSFLTYEAGRDTPQDTARDFACLAMLGTDGCGFEQQLESALKALWPASGVGGAEISFLGNINGFGREGHGEDANAGFLRDDSLLGIVMVTDEEDCSSSNTAHFTPDIYLDPNDPLAMQDLNLRCFFNPQNLYDLRRYENGFKALRPGREELVMFAAIAGVPPALVDEQARAAVNFADQTERDAYYDGLLDDPEMQEVIDSTRTPEQGGNLTPSCVTATGRAFPPRRLVELARRFGDNGVVQSICQDDFSPAIDRIVDRVAIRVTGACYPEALPRDDDGRLLCEVIWALPADPAEGTPASCGDKSFLRSRGDAADRFCSVTQLATGGDAPAGHGWYYDDFSERVADCPEGSQQGIAFTDGAKPPSDVSVFLHCL